jgi:hypothetical protein
VTATVTTTVGVIGRVHNNTADTRSKAHVALTASFANLDILMLLVANNSNSSQAVKINQTHFATRQADLAVVFVFTDQLSTGTGCSNQLSAPARLKLNCMDNGAGWNIL